MREFLTFLTACAVLAAAHALTIAVGLALLALALMAAVTQPRRFHAFVASLALFGFALTEPAYCVAGLAAIGVTVSIVGRRRRHFARREPEPPLLLPSERR